MILASETPREIGKRYVGVDLDGDLHSEQPFVILREVTREEWIVDSLTRFGHVPDAVLPNATCDLSQCRFYEFSVD